MERLLALGSVVKVRIEEQAAARLMIAGYLPRDEDTGEIYDYVTVLYPFGMQQVPAVQMIRQEQILSVEAEGYLDERAEAFTRELPELIGKIAEETQRLIREAGRNEEVSRDGAQVKGQAEAGVRELRTADGLSEFG